ncbi:MAG: 2-hydroxyacyl-CoA dehydratase subunit D [Candidatus Hodarchaeota archaeon]
MPDNDERIRKLGWSCSYTPIELIHAADFTPVRILGHSHGIQVADGYMSPNMCHYVRSVVDMLAEGEYSSLEGIVIVNSCDAMRRLHDVWKEYYPSKFMYLLDLPVKQGSLDEEYFIKEVKSFRETLEKHSGSGITDERLLESVKIYENARRLYNEVESIRKKKNLDAIPAEKLFPLAMDFFTTPVEKWMESTREYIKNLPDSGTEDEKRGEAIQVLVTGCPIHDESLIPLVESSGLSVTSIANCSGGRYFDLHVDVSGNVLENLALAYFNRSSCARMMRLQDRVDYIIEQAKSNDAKGVIHYTLKFCDPYQYDTPNLEKILADAGLKMLVLEDDGSGGNKGQFRTRLEAFKEILS